jgi:putative pyruvate formate lyase activating enzyme
VVCKVCPHQCGVDRADHAGICRAPDKPKVALASLHRFEEPVISGNRGSGTIFFSNCNLACVFCQNSDISQEYQGRVITGERLADIASELKAQGAHNINLVSPTPYSEIIRDALMPAKYGLDIPIVWNSNGYELVSELERMESLVDVYLPDLKFFDAAVAKRYCGTADYFKYASKAIGEMWRQKHEYRLQSVESGIGYRPEMEIQKPKAKIQNAEIPTPNTQHPELMTQGVIIRHLVLPGQAEDSKRILKWIADNIGTDVYISLMAQYTPVHKAYRYLEINRRLGKKEYAAVCDYFYHLGFENGWVQELAAASSDYTPEFNLKGV